MAEIKRPLLSVVIPTYNRERYIARFLDFHSREFHDPKYDVEFVICDNASTDGSIAAYDKYKDNPKFRFFYREETVDAYSNQMSGFHFATGNFVTFMGDDDYLIAEKTFQYLDLISNDPNLIALYAPWFLLDETKENLIIGQFYQIDAPTRFSKGDIAGAMRLVLERLIFPEVTIFRREQLLSIVELPYNQAFWAFLRLRRAVAQGDVIFMPEPFASFTAISRNAKGHIGNDEVMVAWDSYRGGLEFALAPVLDDPAVSSEIRDVYRKAVDFFVADRISIALDFHMKARNWIISHLLHQRLLFMSRPVLDASQAHGVASMAGLQSALQEAKRLGATKIAFDASIPSHMIEALPPSERAMLTENIVDSCIVRPWRRVFIDFNSSIDQPTRSDDLVIDLNDCLQRYLS